jgi:hypothetical protein
MDNMAYINASTFAGRNSRENSGCKAEKELELHAGPAKMNGLHDQHKGIRVRVYLESGSIQFLAGLLLFPIQI